MKRVLLVCGMMLIASDAFGASAQLIWDANTEADLAGYDIFRGNGVCMVGPLQPLLDSNGQPVQICGGNGYDT